MKIVPGALVALIGMWGSAYLGHVLDRWAELPALFTAIISIAAGVCIVGYTLENQK